jgi:hypothetical protein
MAEKFLDNSNVVSRFEAMSCKRVPKGMTACWFGDSGFAYGLFHIALDDGLVKVMSSFPTKIELAEDVLEVATVMSPKT